MHIVDLVTSAQQRNLEALETLFTQFHNMAFGYAYSLLGDVHAAEDAIQESAIDVYRNIHRLRIPQAFPGWYRKIIYRHTVINKRHPPLKWVQVETLDQYRTNQTSPDTEYERNELREIIKNYIDNLTQARREVIILFYFGGYQMTEIADFLAIPLNTVKTRLYQARKDLKQRMETAITEYLNTNLTKNVPYKKIIQGVPGIYQKTETRQIYEDVPLCSCIRATLNAIHDDWGQNHVTINGNKWHYNRAYVRLMGATGLAFRFTWKKTWDISIVSSYLIGREVDTVFKRAWDTVGYTYELLRTKYSGKEKKLTAKEKRDLYLRAKKTITDNIDNGRPLIAHGVIGPPEECLITGYDKNGEVVTGWNIFQNGERTAPEWYADTDRDGIMELNTDLEVDYEPSGYFRKHNWFKDTWSIMHITGKKDKPGNREMYLDALNWAVEIILKDTLYIREYENGIAAYKAFADSLKNLKTGPDNLDELRSKYMVFISAVAMIIDNRTSAWLFLGEMMKEFPEATKPLTAATEMYLKEIETIWEIWNLTGIRQETFSAWPSVSRTHNVEKALKLFSDKDIRARCAAIIRGAIEYETKAAEYLREAARTVLRIGC